MPPALPASLALNLLPESPVTWEIADRPAPAATAIQRSGKNHLVFAAHCVALAVGPVAGLAAIVTGDDWTTALVQAGVTTVFAIVLLQPFAHLAARALARH